jgi:alpha-1,3-glucan synthase
MAKIKRFSCITMQMLDIDGFRIDKALQVTVDAQGDWSNAMRECAADLNKTNFFIPGEVVSGNGFGAVYIGRGKEPGMAFDTIDDAVNSGTTQHPTPFIREPKYSALDAAAFHYSVYRAMTRFLGIDGDFQAEADPPVNWVEGWTTLMKTNDMINTNTNLYDPRHMIGVTNQDIFRWPSLTNGTEKQLLGHFITTMLLPGIPTLVWGEEQALYLLDNTAANYLFGRSPMTSATAWQTHGCYRLGSEKYFDFPLDSALYGCLDDSASLDQRDPTHPIRQILKDMYQRRKQYPVLNDGWTLTQLSNNTYDIYLPGSSGVPTEMGIWSTLRSRYVGLQDFTGQGKGNQSIWLVYGNENKTTDYTFDCTSDTKSFLAPFDAGTTVKNLFYPYDQITLEASKTKLGLEKSTKFSGCLSTYRMNGWGFAAYVPLSAWTPTNAQITKFIINNSTSANPLGHDARITSTVARDGTETIAIEMHFSTEMDCQSVTDNIIFNSTTDSNTVASLDTNSVSCLTVNDPDPQIYTGQLASAWKFTANVVNVANGVHKLVVQNVSSSDGTNKTMANDHFMFRVGQPDNPMIFPRSANYSSDLLFQAADGSLYVSHKATGADQWRYSLNWGSSYSDWQNYKGGNSTLAAQPWSGIESQKWEGDHVIVQYWSQLTGSSSHVQNADVATQGHPERRYPHLFVLGPFNQYGFDSGLPSQMELSSDILNGTNQSVWKFHFMTEFPDDFQVNVWGINPDGKPDQSYVYGDVNNDTVLDRIPPISLLQNTVNVTLGPDSPYLAWRVEILDAENKYRLIPVGNRYTQLILWLLLAFIPLLTAIAAVWVFKTSFYQVKFNQIGISEKRALIPLALRRKLKNLGHSSENMAGPLTKFMNPTMNPSGGALNMEAGNPKRRTVLIATMEYDIEDWGIKIKIGGLGVMAQLMGKNLMHQDLIWVVPCVGDVDYPVDTPAEEMFVTILGNSYAVQVQYHRLRNITYVLLDAPVFRNQTKAEPYPPRMDDLDSAVYYSAWNSCIAEAIKRFPVDLYHINDYHGALAPLHLLPETVPCCLSLHNAEFQGLWPMRTPKEREEVNQVYNLDSDVSERYVQFGEAFNLLHAGASYLRVHQKGFGAVGVSKKYGKRSFLRYPIFWGLTKIGSLPNPDPTDLAAWTGELPKVENITVDAAFEAGRPELRLQAQKWAGLNQDPTAELFVFVGRWSLQKGIDLIADVFPAILEKNSKVQLICVGPVIDLYGKFAALKLDKMMKLYPGRVYSKPEFTALPPYIFSGAEFALIPSRDEPFGLVAVEFGRKGALGVGSRVGGLGQMPGWWFTIESTTTKHLIHQFKEAVHGALSSKTDTRAKMRARSSLQRFPVAQWVEDLDILQSTAIKISQKQALKPSKFPSRPSSPNPMRSHGSMLDLGQGNSPYRHSAMTDLSHYRSSGYLPDSPSMTQLQVPDSPAMSQLHPNRYSTRSVSGERQHMPTSPGSMTPTGSLPGTPGAEDALLPPPNISSLAENRHRDSLLSLGSVVGEKKDFVLQQVDPFFTDVTGEYFHQFEQKLDELNGKTSEHDLCIEEHLIKSEKRWFREMHDAKLGRSNAGSPAPSVFRMGGTPSPAGSIFNEPLDGHHNPEEITIGDQFLLGEDYVPPTGIKYILQLKVADWPIYSFLIGFGQIIAANSYQITLLTGEVGQTAEKLYVIASIYLVASILWWFIYRKFKAMIVLSIPFLFYGVAFLFVGMAYFVTDTDGRGWMHNVASGFYSVASASGSIYFALNFGDEGGAPVESWVFRASIIQGSQQIYVVALWYWGSALTKLTQNGAIQSSLITSSWIIVAICVPLAVLMWVIAAILYLGLPDFYRRVPGKVPSFYASLLRRKTIMVSDYPSESMTHNLN